MLDIIFCKLVTSAGSLAQPFVDLSDMYLVRVFSYPKLGQCRGRVVFCNVRHCGAFNNDL